LAEETVPEGLERWRRDPRVAIGVVVLVIIGAAVAWIRVGSSAAPAPAAPTSSVVPSPSSSAPAVALVHVVGAVVAPGVVELDAGARVLDALTAAGGATPDADLQRLNLAAPVADGQRVAVPRIGEALPPPVEGSADPGLGGPSGLVNLNTATAAELEALPGIGPALAGAIVAERETRGRFESVEDLKQVRGIGEQRFADLKDLVTV
jgi:competence protein ComEA